MPVAIRDYSEPGGRAAKPRRIMIPGLDVGSAPPGGQRAGAADRRMESVRQAMERNQENRAQNHRSPCCLAPNRSRELRTKDVPLVHAV